MADAKTTTFIAKCSNQLLTMSPSTPAVKALNGAIIAAADPGRHIQFVDGRFETSDSEEIEFLRDHKLFNSRFYEEGNAPDEPKPTVKEQLSAVARAIAASDPDAIQAVLDEERATHDRDVVTSAAQEGLVALADEGEEKQSSPSTSTASATA